MAAFLRGCVFQREQRSDTARGDSICLSECTRQLSGGKEASLAERLLDPSMCHLTELYVPFSKPWCVLFGSHLTFLKSKGTGKLDLLITPFPSRFQLHPYAHFTSEHIKQRANFPEFHLLQELENAQVKEMRPSVPERICAGTGRALGFSPRWADLSCMGHAKGELGAL